MKSGHFTTMNNEVILGQAKQATINCTKAISSSTEDNVFMVGFEMNL